METMMNPVYLLSIDLGTSFIKAGVYDEKGNCYVHTKTPLNTDHSIPGVFVQHGDEIFESVLACMRRVADVFGNKSRKIAAIGFTGQMAGVIGVDEHWNDLTAWSCSLDTRYLPYAARQMEKLGEDFLDIGGTNSPLMAPKCQWFSQEFPEKAVKVRKYMLISSYIIGRLGRCRIEDASVGSSYITWTGLADIRTGAWSEKLCEGVGISEDVLPRIVNATDICGYLDESYASMTGLCAGIPLVAGAGDKISGCVGSGILNAGDTIFEASSYGAVSCLQEEYHPNYERKDYDAIPACGTNQFYLHRYLPGSGITLKWFLDTFGTVNFDEMEQAISRLPCGSEGLLAVGLLGGNAMPLDGEICGSWVGYTWSHKREHFYRALLESYAYELKATLNSIGRKYPRWNRYSHIHVIGGGAGSDTWVHILADVTGSAFIRHSRDDAAMWGTAMLAGTAIGLFQDLKQASASAADTWKITFPDQNNFRIYSDYAGLYEELKQNLKHTYYKLHRAGGQSE